MLIDSLKIKLILEAKPGEDPFLVRSILKRWLRNSITNFAIFFNNTIDFTIYPNTGCLDVPHVENRLWSHGITTS